MREGRRTARLGDLFVPVATRLGAHATEPPVFSLSKYDGVVFASEYFDKRIASEKLDAYKVLEPDGWAYSTIHIDEGSIAVNRLGESGVLSPMYTTMHFVSTEDDDRYVELLLRSAQMLAEYRANAAGTVNRRRSLAFKTFANLRVSLPPLDEQRRIVDVVRCLSEAASCAASVVARATGALHLAIREETTLSGGAAWQPLTGVVEVLDNQRVPVNEKERALRVGDVPYFGAVGQAGWIDAALFDEPLVLLAEDGARLKEWATKPIAYTIEGPAWVNNHAHVLRPLGLPIGWLYFSLRHYDISALMNAGTRPKLNKGALSSIRIRIPQAGQLERLSAIETLSRAAEREREALTKLRTEVVADLLSGNHEIPESYDRLMESA